MHVDIHKSAKEDLERLWQSDAAAAATVAVVLQELQGNPRAAARLIAHGETDVGSHLVNMRRWQVAKPHPLWRLRILDSPATSYRVVYGYHAQTRQICVLAVVHKDQFDYETNSDLGQRILADWRRI